MKQTQITQQFARKILDQMADMQAQSQKMNKDITQEKPEGKTFSEHLKEGIADVNTKHTVADKMAADLATGQSGNIHETMIAATQAELSFNLMVQIRNKALEAYNEIMRMPV